jgi:isocitrate lyase
MGKGSTQFQHLVQIEVPPKLLEEWLEVWARRHDVPGKLKVSLRPHTVGSDVLELRVLSAKGEPLATIVFATIQDRRGRTILSVRDQNTLDPNLRRKRLMTLVQLFLMHRYKANSVHFVTPSDDNQRQTERMKARGIFSAMANEVGEMIVAEVDTAKVKALVEKKAIEAFIAET